MCCGVGHRHSSDPALLWLWCRPGAAALIWPLAWELPYATGAGLKIKTKDKRSSPFKHPLTGGTGQSCLGQGYWGMWAGGREGTVLEEGGLAGGRCLDPLADPLIPHELFPKIGLAGWEYGWSLIFLLLSKCPASTSLSPTQNVTVVYYHEFKIIKNNKKK